MRMNGSGYKHNVYNPICKLSNVCVCVFRTECSQFSLCASLFLSAHSVSNTLHGYIYSQLWLS
ncbi:hypothetical protein Hanom_Chr10g00957891 [Helianthus anomalus]